MATLSIIPQGFVVLLRSLFTTLVATSFSMTVNAWKNTYGKLPTSTERQPFYRVAPIKGVEITDEVLRLLGSEDGKTAVIMIPWDKKGMTVHKGGYLADFEYAIAPQEMKANYTRVAPDTLECHQ